MKYNIRLTAPMSESFRAMRAANSLDIDIKKKSIHEFSVDADIEKDFKVGLIVGASGSGKSTLAREMFGSDCFKNYLDKNKAVIDQFPEEMSYDECAVALTGMGLSSVPCWLKASGVLSNGQQARAEAALAIVTCADIVVIDEWTSVVDRTVAKIMSHCVQKFARRSQKKIVLVSCHHDVIEWLNPDWIIDCNSQRFIDRRSLRQDRQERLQFNVREVTSSSWQRFSKYHYLSSKPLGGRVHHFGLFHGFNQIGYSCLANYVPWSDKSKPMIMHLSRIVIHPDYAGLSLGLKFGTSVAAHGKSIGYRVLSKFSTVPFFKLMSRDRVNWRHLKTSTQIGRTAHGSLGRGDGGYRENVKTYVFEYIGSK